MPVHKVKGGYRYGHPGHGHKVFKSKSAAMKQAKAIAISKARASGHYIQPKSGITKRRHK